MFIVVWGSRFPTAFLLYLVFVRGTNSFWILLWVLSQVREYRRLRVIRCVCVVCGRGGGEVQHWYDVAWRFCERMLVRILSISSYAALFRTRFLGCTLAPAPLVSFFYIFVLPSVSGNLPESHFVGKNVEQVGHRSRHFHVFLPVSVPQKTKPKPGRPLNRNKINGDNVLVSLTTAFHDTMLVFEHASAISF